MQYVDYDEVTHYLHTLGNESEHYATCAVCGTKFPYHLYLAEHYYEKHPERLLQIFNDILEAINDPEHFFFEDDACVICADRYFSSAKKHFNLTHKKDKEKQYRRYIDEVKRRV